MSRLLFSSMVISRSPLDSPARTDCRWRRSAIRIGHVGLGVKLLWLVWITLVIWGGMVQGASIWEERPGHQFMEVMPVSGSRLGFTRLPGAQTGLTFTNHLAQSRYVTNQILLNGSGVALGDVDGDGLCDIYFCALDGANALYRNLGGWKFENATYRSGVACAGTSSTGAALADLDGDGDLDLVVNSVGSGTRVFHNDGKGKFTEFVGPGGRLNSGRGGMSLALADIDGDEDLDLYVTNYRIETIRDQPGLKIHGEFVQGRPVVARVDGKPASDPAVAGRFTLEPNGKIREHGEVDALFLNDGTGRFVSVPFTGGAFLDASGKPLTTPPQDWGLSASFRDINGDGKPDLYVCNDFESEDRIWMNNGKGRFRALPAFALRHTSLFSMGIDFGDLNRDGLDDFFVADMMSRSHENRNLLLGDVTRWMPRVGVMDDRPQYSHNTLFLNRGGGRYTEIAFYAGLQASDWSWTPVLLDVDMDGYEDLLITTGHELEMMNADVIQKAEELKSKKAMSGLELLELRLLFRRFALPHVAFRNQSGGRFEDKTAEWGFDESAVSHGMALADLDNDGDMDVVINNLNGEASVYRNEASGGRVSILLRGAGRNSQGIGAVVRLFGGAVPMQQQEMMSGGRYLSSDQAARVFASGGHFEGMRLEVGWPSGRKSVVSDVRANRTYRIFEPMTGESLGPREIPAVSPWFADVSGNLGHRHFEEEFDDYNRQPLLPRKFSQLGPGVCWTDVDDDGWDDLVIGSGKGGQLALYRNDRKGGFERHAEAPLIKHVGRDQTAVVGFGKNLFVGLANYEDGSTNGGHLGVYDLGRKASGESVLGPQASTGPVLLGDVDGDGDLDVFIGGRVIAGRYPAPASSLWLRNDNGRLVVAHRFEGLGLVSGAVFTDLDGDGFPELVLALEWGTPRVYWNLGGRFEDRTTEMGLGSYSGWWNGVTAGDLDGDGRMDFACSNWGLNHSRATPRKTTRKVYHGESESWGGHSFIETFVDGASGRELPEPTLKALRAAMPIAVERFQTFEAFAKSSASQIFGATLEHMPRLEAREFASMVFLNRGDRFEAVELPVEAQLSAGFGLSVADFDGDGIEDMFMSQNWFCVSPESTRMDGGFGLVLKGLGGGRFHPLSVDQSGIEVFGEQRGCAVADYDRDGRPDLVVSQNGAATKLFSNIRGKPGLRVRFKGPASNPFGFGVRLVLESDGKKLPAREIHGGSGYWSQDSAAQVLAVSEHPSKLYFTVPGGARRAAEVPAGAREVEVGFNGDVKVIR